MRAAAPLHSAESTGVVACGGQAGDRARGEGVEGARADGGVSPDPARLRGAPAEEAGGDRSCGGTCATIAAGQGCVEDMAWVCAVLCEVACAGFVFL